MHTLDVKEGVGAQVVHATAEVGVELRARGLHEQRVHVVQLLDRCARLEERGNRVPIVQDTLGGRAWAYPL